MHMAQYCNESELLPLPEGAADAAKAEFERILSSDGQSTPYELRERMQKLMTARVGVFRVEEGMQAALEELRNLREAYQTDIRIDDKGRRFNSDLLEAWELGCLLELAEVTTLSALTRKESRGGHARDDYGKRNDDEWLKHTLCYSDGEDYRLDYKPVVIGRYQPKERVY